MALQSKYLHLILTQLSLPSHLCWPIQAFVFNSDSHALQPRVKNKRELNASLKGATLGDPDADGDDALSWVKKSKKREKLLAKKRMEELENMDKLFQEEYTESACGSFRFLCTVQCALLV